MCRGCKWRLFLCLQNTTISGVTGNILFDSYGDLVGGIVVYQYRRVVKNSSQSYVAVRVGRSDNTGNSVSSLSLGTLEWTNFRQSEDDELQPESLCGRPCKVGQYAVQLSITCCWRCETCPKDGDVSRLFTFLKQLSRSSYWEARSYCVLQMPNVKFTMLQCLHFRNSLISLFIPVRWKKLCRS